MTKQFGKTNVTTVEIGRQRADTTDVNSDKYRILFAHVHIVALALSMVGFCFHILMTYEDFKKGLFYRMFRHIPCAILFALVVAGNRLMKPMLYFFYLIFNFLFVAFIIVAEIMRQYRIRTDPELQTHIRHSIFFFSLVWCIIVLIEILIYYIIYRDYKFVKEVRGNVTEKIQVFRVKDKPAPVARY